MAVKTRVSVYTVPSSAARYDMINKPLFHTCHIYNFKIVSFQYATGTCLLLENVGGCVHPGRPEVVTLNICYNWPVLFRTTHILQENVCEHMPVAYWKDNFRVHVSPGSAETLVRRGGIINHHSTAYSLSNISAKNYRNRLMWVESIVCNISVVF